MAGGIDTFSGYGRRRFKPTAEINVTPFVDVMLVLLIVFMVSAPLLTVGVEVDLPDTEARALMTSEEPLTLTIQADGTLYLMEGVIPFEELVARLEAIVEAGSETRIYIRADDGAPYGEVMRVMARMSTSGYTNIGLITDPVQQ